MLMKDTVEHMPESGVQIIQATPGRLQVRVPQLAHDAELAGQLEQFALHTGGITSILINRAAASFVITYRADAGTNAKIRSCLEKLVESDRQTASPPVQPQFPEAERDLEERQHSEVELQQQSMAAQTQKYEALQQEQQQAELVGNLQQQLENLQQSMAAQTQKYEALQQKEQQQAELVGNLQQQLSEAERDLEERQHSEVELQQQLENLQQSVAAQTQKYETLQQKEQQQAELVSNLQQQLSEIQTSSNPFKKIATLCSSLKNRYDI